MRLRELRAEFLKYSPEGDRVFYKHVDSLAEADGIRFLCPKCYAANGGAVGTHSVICWFRGKVADSVTPGPGRWTPAGTGLDDLTFAPGDPTMAQSIALDGGCRWHGFVRNGDAS